MTATEFDPTKGPLLVFHLHSSDSVRSSLSSLFVTYGQKIEIKPRTSALTPLIILNVCQDAVVGLVAYIGKMSGL